LSAGSSVGLMSKTFDLVLYKWFVHTVKYTYLAIRITTIHKNGLSPNRQAY